MMLDFTEAVARLNEFERLPIGWEFGSGTPISARARYSAVVLSRILDGMNIDGFNLMPGHDGSVMLVSYRANESCEIECIDDDTYNLFFESPKVVDFDEIRGVSLDQLIVELGVLNWHSPRLFASCTQSVMTRTSDASIPQHLGTRTKVVSPSFAVHVSTKDHVQSVSTSENSTITRSQDARRSSGDFQLIKWESVCA